MTEGNVLYYGDNLDVLERHIASESVDLIYLDPPFNSNRDYNVLFEEHGEKAAAQVRAFEDTWEWNQDSRAAYESVVEQGGRVSDTMRAFRTMLGGSDMLAYLSMMAPRLIELQRVLKPSGTLYLHCDDTASHYLKLLLDAVFEPRNFRNEIIWRYRRWPSKQKNFQRMHDVLLRYSKSREVTWNQLFEPLSEQTQKRIKGGQKIVTFFDADTGKKRIRATDEVSKGVPMSDVWEIPQIVGPTPERLGFPTQKPEALLERVIAASSNEGDVVLDPFAGCGTAVAVAQRLNRAWIGIDITHIAIGLIKNRLLTRFGSEITGTYRVIGEPTTVEGAAVLAKEDPWQFQAWALGLVGARVAGSDKKGGDKGIDGKLYFHEGDGETRQIILSVKAGNVNPGYVDGLWGVVEREKAEIGVLISFQEPTDGMKARAADAGFYESPWGKHPRLQLRTIRELLDGKGIDYPPAAGANVTLRRAQRARARAESMPLFAQAAEEP